MLCIFFLPDLYCKKVVTRYINNNFFCNCHLLHARLKNQYKARGYIKKI